MATLDVDGIAVEFDKSTLLDPRVATLMGDLEDGSLDYGEKLVSQSRLLRIVFGREQRDRIQDELAARSETFDNAALGAWWIAFLKAANAKN
jgi:hypothetical protein